MIEAIIFDRDGVLTDFDVEAAVAFFDPLLPISVEALSERWLQWGKAVGFPNNPAEEKKFWRDFWNHLSDELALTSTTRAKLQEVDYTMFLRPFPDAKIALKVARQRGLRTGVLSNFSLATLEDSLVTAGLAEFVDVAYAAPVIGVAKPNPEAYLKVTRSLNVQPKECLFFDDEMPHVEGARALGMEAYLVDRNRKENALSEGIVCDLAASITILERTP